MSYSVYLSGKAKKQLRKLEKDLLRRILKKLKTLSEEPYIKTEPVQGTHFRKIRVGSWRAIVEIADDISEVLVVIVGKRENIYEELKMV